MKSLLFAVSLLFVPALFAQQIEVAPVGFTAQNDLRTFSLEQVHIQKENSELSLTGNHSSNSARLQNVRSFSLSPGLKLLSVLNTKNSGQLSTHLYDSQGRKLSEFELEHFSPDDNTLDMIVFDDGRMVVRDNVVNFTFYDNDGSIFYNLSNSVGSTGGEAVSEFKSDRYGRTVVVYNPQVRYEGETGSRARIVRGENQQPVFYESRERVIKWVEVTESGSYITLVTEKEGTDDQLLIFDRFGNPVRQFATQENIVGSVLTEDARFITLHSENRVQVFRIRDLERIGSTSIRGAALYYAVYVPEDQQILAFSGIQDSEEEGDPRRIREPEVHAIHLEKRQIARTEIDFPLSTMGIEKIRIERIETERFLINGFNRQMEVQTHF